MQLTIISDTHGHEATLGRMEGDVLIHCGDVLGGLGRHDADLDALDAWFGEQDFRHILFVGGNHDRALQRRARSGLQPLQNATCLQDSGLTIDGIRFYGAPWVPKLLGHAYFLRAAALAERWSRIPAQTDVLITHSPPAGILDETSRGWRVGCEALSRAVVQVQPRLHCFGHVHASYGWAHHPPTVFANAAMLRRSGSLKEPLRITL